MPETPPRLITVPYELLVDADSYLSLLWYRPSTPRDVEFTMAVQRTIQQLRDAYMHARTEHP